METPLLTDDYLEADSVDTRLPRKLIRGGGLPAPCANREYFPEDREDWLVDRTSLSKHEDRGWLEVVVCASSLPSNILEVADRRRLRHGDSLIRPPCAKIRQDRPVFLVHAERHARNGNLDTALDLIYDGVDGLMKSSEWDTLRNLFSIFRPSPKDIDICIGLLAASIPVRSKFPERKTLYDAVWDHLKESGENPAEELVGLD